MYWYCTHPGSTHKTTTYSSAPRKHCLTIHRKYQIRQHSPTLEVQHRSLRAHCPCTEPQSSSIVLFCIGCIYIMQHYIRFLCTSHQQLCVTSHFAPNYYFAYKPPVQQHHLLAQAHAHALPTTDTNQRHRMKGRGRGGRKASHTAVTCNNSQYYGTANIIIYTK